MPQAHQPSAVLAFFAPSTRSTHSPDKHALDGFVLGHGLARVGAPVSHWDTREKQRNVSRYRSTAANKTLDDGGAYDWKRRPDLDSPPSAAPRSVIVLLPCMHSPPCCIEPAHVPPPPILLRFAPTYCFFQSTHRTRFTWPRPFLLRPWFRRLTVMVVLCSGGEGGRRGSGQLVESWGFHFHHPSSPRYQPCTTHLHQRR